MNLSLRYPPIIIFHSDTVYKVFISYPSSTYSCHLSMQQQQQKMVNVSSVKMVKRLGKSKNQNQLTWILGGIYSGTQISWSYSFLFSFFLSCCFSFHILFHTIWMCESWKYPWVLRLRGCVCVSHICVLSWTFCTVPCFLFISAQVLLLLHIVLIVRKCRPASDFPVIVTWMIFFPTSFLAFITLVYLFEVPTLWLWVLSSLKWKYLHMFQRILRYHFHNQF